MLLVMMIMSSKSGAVDFHACANATAHANANTTSSTPPVDAITHALFTLSALLSAMLPHAPLHSYYVTHWGGVYNAVPPLGRVNPSRRQAQNPYSDSTAQK